MYHRIRLAARKVRFQIITFSEARLGKQNLHPCSRNLVRSVALVVVFLFGFVIVRWPIRPPGGTDLERGYGGVRPWRPPFHASPVVRKGPTSSKRVSSQDSLLRKFGNFSLYRINFHPNFSSQATKFGNFQFTSPNFQRQISVHKAHTS